MAFEGSLVSMSSRVSLPFLSSIVAPMRSPAARIVSFSGSTSILTWSDTSWTSSMAWCSPSVVILARMLKVILGVGTSSSVASSVGMLNVRSYLPLMVMFSLLVFSSSASSTVSSLPVRRRSLSISVMLMHIFMGWSQVYSSNTVLGHSKSIMATRLGSMARSLRFSGVMLNVASSTSVLMAVIMSRRSLASFSLALNNFGLGLLSRFNLMCRCCGGFKLFCIHGLKRARMCAERLSEVLWARSGLFFSILPVRLGLRVSL